MREHTKKNNLEIINSNASHIYMYETRSIFKGGVGQFLLRKLFISIILVQPLDVVCISQTEKVSKWESKWERFRVY